MFENFCIQHKCQKVKHEKKRGKNNNIRSMEILIAFLSPVTEINFSYSAGQT